MWTAIKKRSCIIYGLKTFFFPSLSQRKEALENAKAHEMNHKNLQEKECLKIKLVPVKPYQRQESKQNQISFKMSSSTGRVQPLFLVLNLLNGFFPTEVKHFPLQLLPLTNQNHWIFKQEKCVLQWYSSRKEMARFFKLLDFD